MGGAMVVVVVVLLLAIEAVGTVATGTLNADGVALLAFKDAIWSDPQSALQTWNYSSDAGSNSSTPCLWTGITCVPIRATGEDRVVSIDLSRRALGGTLPPTLGDLGFLAILNLQSNKLTGHIPKELFNSGAVLSRLYLSDNNLTGGIPPEMAQLVRLERLDLSVNELTGSIPDDFGNLTSLQSLNLSNNRFSGAIPPSLANLRTVPIDLSNNELAGPVPSGSYFQSQGPVAYVGNAGLCGAPLNVDCASPSPLPGTSETDTNSARPLRKAAVVAIAVAGLMLTASFVLYFLIRGRRLCSWRQSANGAHEGDLDPVVVHLSGAMSFGLEELLRASAYVLGESGVGIVYKAVLDESTVVAVRRLDGEPKRKEFEIEVKSIAQVTRHPNVVSLHSYSWTPDEKLLIYDYLPNGSLETALHGLGHGRSEGSSFEERLTWNARLRIARGAAQGLAHIHDCSPGRKLVHGDIKPSNILLDGFLEPRIADFGLQRLLSLMAQPAHIKDTTVSATPTGARNLNFFDLSLHDLHPSHRVAPFVTSGPYQAPEILNAKRPTQKSDVYSFGVVLLELLTGRSPLQQLDLVSWIRVALQRKNSALDCDIFDPALQIDANAGANDDSQTKMIEILQVALACIAVNPDLRPKMKQVAEFFEQIQATS